jgi:hypothetical protein
MDIKTQTSRQQIKKSKQAIKVYKSTLPKYYIIL